MPKVMIVDDDSDIADALGLILTESGYKTQVFTDGASVVENLLKNPPDLLILDVLLSGFDGRDVAKTLKTNAKTKAIPIIMISAHPTAEWTAREAGANSFLPKPFNLDMLLDEVEKLLHQSS